jgi:hypothetical protein
VRAGFIFLFYRKRYKKAEKEFLDAKLHLFERLERKELLTEHLCTIIEQNEIRKARKLSELMNRLQPGRCEGDFRMAAGNVVSHVMLWWVMEQDRGCVGVMLRLQCTVRLGHS